MNFTTACSARTYSKLKNSIIYCIAAALLASCTKPEDGYLNAGSGNHLFNLIQTDTLSIDMVTEHWPRLPSTANLSVDEIGTFIDPVFGRTTASLYAQVRIGTAALPSWGPSSTMDSVVLTLKMSNISSATGTNNFAGQTWHVYKIARGDAFSKVGSVYPSDTVLPTSLEIGHALVNFRAKDSVLRVSIPSASINKIFRDSIFDSTGNGSLFTDATFFDQLMHGIFIRPDSVLSGTGAGEIAGFNLSDTNSRLTINYDAGKSWYMVMSSPAMRVNVYDHNYTNTEAAHHFGLASNKYDRVYIQSLAGVKCVVKVPYLANLVKDNMVAINQAEFIFPKVDSLSDPFNTSNPAKMLFRPRRSDGNDSIYAFTDDITDYYGQNYQAASKSYKFIMTRYIQRLCYDYRNKPNLHNFGMNLSIPPDNPNSPSRMVLYTQNTGNKQNRPRLVITYTKIVDKK